MKDLIAAMAELDEDAVLATVEQLHEQGADRQTVLRMLNEGMQQVGRHFENGEYFLADLIVSGIIYRKAMERMGGDGQASGDSVKEHVLIGVVKNDIHDIGKDIIVSALRSDGYQVTDLGTDVDGELFVQAALETRPQIILLCGAMTYAAGEMRTTIQKLDAAGVRGFSHIVVGGLGVSEQESRDMKADAYSQDPIELLGVCRKLLMSNG